MFDLHPFLAALIWVALICYIYIFLLLFRQKSRLKIANTDLQRINQELMRTNEKTALILDMAHDAFIAIDPDGFVSEWNNQAEHIFGLTREEAIGRKLACVIIPPDKQITLANDIRQFFEAGVDPVLRRQMEVMGLHKNGRNFPVELSISVSRYQNTYSFNAFVRDISEAKRLEKMRDEFISTVSHELRTPLAIVKGAVANLHDGIAGPLNEKQQKVLASTARNVARLARLINDLLDLSRLESGRAKLVKSRFDLKNVIEEILHTFKAEADDKKIALEAHYDTSHSEVEGNPDMITQVLSNLINNALRYTRTKITISTKLADSCVHVCVEDDGQGIEEHHLKLIFDKFEQINRPMGGAGYKGTGLGLAICKEIIELHHGKIWAESVLEKGSQFHFTLPLK